MSFNIIGQANDDAELRYRTNACTEQQARSDPAHNTTPLADLVRRGRVDVLAQFQWYVALAGEAEYASALAAGNPHPGADETVITDGDILSAVQTNWDTVSDMYVEQP